ncbi:MAG: hypothetical protein ABI576_11245 [Flavobacterium sp.]
MSKFGIIVKKPNEQINTNYTALVSQNLNNEFVITLFNDQVSVVNSFIDIYIENAIVTALNFVQNDIGQIINTFEIFNDPQLPEILRKLREN